VTAPHQEAADAALPELLARQSDVLTTAQALRHLTREAVRWRVRSARWQRPYRGVLVAHSGPLSTDQRLWVDVLRAGSGVEIDGGAHRAVRAWWEDMRRQNEIWLRGDRLLRFPAYLLRSEPATVAGAIRAALTAAGWSSSARLVAVGVVGTTPTATNLDG
jgi:hypothetical protein